MIEAVDRKGTFDTAAGLYDKFRPGYTDELYQKIFAWIPLNAESRAVEVGPGAGQATLPILHRGCRVTAVEYGENLSRLCREKFKDFPNFLVLTGKFEEVFLEKGAYDLVYSASAFHWIPEETGYAKAFSLLKSGGVFARFANRPARDPKNEALFEEIDKLYQIYMPSSHPPQFTEEDAKALSLIPLRYGFSETFYALYHRTRTFSAQEYVSLLGTYSDHIALEEEKRRGLFEGIAQAIRRHGGTITLYDTIDLELARKP